MAEQSNSNNSGSPVFVLGQEFLLDFGVLLAGALESNLSARWGDDWFKKCISDTEASARTSKDDLHFLLKETLDRNNHNFRVAIAHEFFSTTILHKTQLDALESVMKARNLWAHPERTIHLKDLKKLAVALLCILVTDQPLKQKCQKVMLMKDATDSLEKIAVLTNLFEFFGLSKFISPSGEIGGEDVRGKLLLLPLMRESAKRLSDGISVSDLGGDDHERELLVTGLFHFIEDLILTLELTESTYASNMLDEAFTTRHPRSGDQLVSNDQLLELQKEIDVEGVAKRLVSETKEKRMQRRLKKCDCFYCSAMGDGSPFLLNSKTFMKTAQLSYRLSRLEPIDDLFETPRGPIRMNDMKIMACVIATRNGQDLDHIYDKWDFTIIDERFNSDSGFQMDGSVEVIAQMLAIWNGVPYEEVKNWDFE